MEVVVMRKIYIIQMHTRTIPSKIVKLFTRYKYSHVAISFNKNCDYIYSFGRRNLYSILKGGFIMEYKNGSFFKKFRNTDCRIYEVCITNNQYNDLVKIVKYMKKNKLDYGYDYVGIVFRFLGVPVTFKKKYVCSYFVAELLKEANIYEFDKNTCFVKPRDFEDIDILNLIYTGKYALYR